MRKLVGVIGSGNMGRDPFDKRSWSGSSQYFFNTCREKGVLERAFGVEIPNYLRYPLVLRHFHPNKKIWREQFYQDTIYYDLLTKEIREQIRPDDFAHDFIQIGAYYNVPSIVGDRGRCFSYHDGDYINTMRSPFRKNLISKEREQRVLQYAGNLYHQLDKVFTMSEYLRVSLIEGYDLPADRVVSIGAGINLDQLPAVSQKRYDNKGLLFVGIDFHRKGGDFVIKAFQKIRQEVPEATLHIVGPRQLPGEYSGLPGVEYHGFISRHDPEGKSKFQRIFDVCSVFVLASLYEPFGIAPLEGMANKMPAVLPNKWAFPEMVVPGKNGELFGLEDEDDFISKVVPLLRKEPEELEAMGNCARETVEQEFTWSRVVDKMLEAIR